MALNWWLFLIYSTKPLALYHQQAFPAYIYLFKVKNGNTREKVWNMFKVNNEDIGTTTQHLLVQSQQ